MSSSWSTPDPRRPVGTFAPAAVDPARPRAWLLSDVRAGLVALVASVLLGAPVGLLWSAFAPRVDVVLAGGNANLAMPGTSDFIAADGYFLFITVVAGVVGGLAAWALGRRPSPGAVLGLAVGSLLAAVVAMNVGELVGAADVEDFVRSGQQGPLELTLRLRAEEVLVGWPVGALVAYLVATWRRGDRGVSSG